MHSNKIDSSDPLNGRIKAYLSEHRWNEGMQNFFIQHSSEISLRYYLCDDSQSMNERDGTILRATRKDSYEMVQATRWQELSHTMKFHVNLAKVCEIHAEFRLLNGADPIVLNSENPRAADEINALLDMVPSGITPLCHHINEVIEAIRSHEAQLRSSGQVAIVVIATDGESSDGKILEAMKPLESLPCFVIVKLCTNEDRVVSYWNNVDKSLKLNMDIIDDFTSEAMEVFEKNSWLTYGEPLHRLREFGVTVKELDLLDERSLVPGQIHKVVSIILGGEFPNPDSQPDKFIKSVAEALKKENKVFDPITKKLQPWFKIDLLEKIIKPQISLCSIM